MRMCLSQILCNEARRVANVHEKNICEKKKYKLRIDWIVKERIDASENQFFSPTPILEYPNSCRKYKMLINIAKAIKRMSSGHAQSFFRPVKHQISVKYKLVRSYKMQLLSVVN